MIRICLHLRPDPLTMTFYSVFTLGLMHSQRSERRRSICPIALVVGCKKCPAISVCLLKGVIGDYRKQEETQIKQQSDDDKK